MQESTLRSITGNGHPNTRYYRLGTSRFEGLDKRVMKYPYFLGPVSYLRFRSSFIGRDGTFVIYSLTLLAGANTKQRIGRQATIKRTVVDVLVLRAPSMLVRGN